MAINTGKIQGVHVVRELLKDLRAFGSITLPAVHTQLGLSLNAENAIRAYYSVKNFKKSVDILLAQADLDEVHLRETGETTGIRADLTALNTSISGTPVIECGAALTISAVSKNAGAVTINGVSVAANKAIQFTVTPSISGWFLIDAKCGTDAGQTLEAELVLLVKGTAV